MVEIQIEFRGHEGNSCVREYLEVSPLGNNLFRLEHTPVFFEDINFGDVVELEPVAQDPEIWRFVRVVELSNWRHTSRILCRSLVQSERFQLWLESIMERGGFWEVAFDGIVIISWPPDAAIDCDAEMNEVIKPYSA